MAKILVTGMSGTGKSTALEMLAARGHRTVDTDTDQWSYWVTLPDGSTDWVWREPAISDLLTNHGEGALFVAGCKSNQGRFYPQFDHVVLLSAPAQIMPARIATRTNNPSASASRNVKPSCVTWPAWSRCSGPPALSRLTLLRRSTRSSSSLRNSRKRCRDRGRRDRHSCLTASRSRRRSSRALRGVQLGGDGVELNARANRQVGALGEVLAQQAVGLARA